MATKDQESTEKLSDSCIVILGMEGLEVCTSLVTREDDKGMGLQNPVYTSCSNEKCKNLPRGGECKFANRVRRGGREF